MIAKIDGLTNKKVTNRSSHTFESAKDSCESGVLAPESAVNDLKSEATLCINRSVPAFPVSDKKARALRSRLEALQCSEQDLEESFFKGNGVDLRHRVTGIRIRCCRETSQALNRFLARRLLADELEARLQNKTRFQVKAEKLREAKGKRSAPGVTDKLRHYVLRPIERKNEY
jgi:hypothetical protein